MRSTQAVKLFLVIMLSVSYIVSFSNFGILAYEKFVNEGDTFPEKTTVAQRDISGKDVEETLQILRADQEEWLATTVISIQYKEIEDRFDVNLFNFLLDETIAKIIPGQENRHVATLATEDVEEMQFIVGTEQSLHVEELKKALTLLASELKKGIHTLKLEDYLKEAIDEEAIISQASVAGSEHIRHVQRWAGEFPTIEVAPYARFSMFELLEATDDSLLSDETLSIVATALYETVLSTNFKIIERHLSREFPSYAKEGFEAKIERAKEMDFVFVNPNDQAYKVESFVENNTLHVRLVGPDFLYTYDIVTSGRETAAKKTIVQFDPFIPRGQTRVDREGQDGFLIRVDKETVDANGFVRSKELVSEDYYRPVHRIEQHSLTEEDIPADAQGETAELYDIKNNPGAFQEEEAS